MDRRALLVINRESRQGATAHHEAVKLLRTARFTIVEPNGNPHPDEAIRRYAEGVDLVIVGGGDGSLNGSADAVIATGKPLGILPLGTANDLARSLEIPTDLPTACQIISDGHTRKIDLGRVNGKPFFNVASVGLSVAVTRRLTKSSKGWLGVFAYLVAAARTVGSRPPFRVEIRCDGQSYKGRTLQVAVGNGRHYGGGLTVAEHASLDDHLLDVYSLEVEHWLGLIPLLPSLWKGTLAGHEQVRVLHGREVEIHTSRPRSVSADGEVVTKTPAIFRVEQDAVTVFAPQKASLDRTRQAG